jgi:ABC-type multidrug transport system ATPase subunit
MLSLIEPSDGVISYFGETFSRSKRAVFNRIGALVEKPDFYLYLSAFRNLHYFASLSNADVSKKNLLRMLELVGLKGREYDKVKTYSLGMKQRLGIAQALIHNPDLIILDEPTNGLDPQGMKEIKDLLMSLVENDGKTVFISSHILREVETMATSMAIINKGKTVVQGNVNDLLNGSELRVSFEFIDIAKANQQIGNTFLKEKVFEEKENTITFNCKSKIEISELIRHFSNNEIELVSVTPKRSLEEYFLELTSNEGASNA